MGWNGRESVALAATLHSGDVVEIEPLAFSDAYFDWWVTKTFGTYGSAKPVTLHFCTEVDCKELPEDKDVFHVTAWRAVTAASLDSTLPPAPGAAAGAPGGDMDDDLHELAQALGLGTAATPVGAGAAARGAGAPGAAAGAAFPPAVPEAAGDAGRPPQGHRGCGGAALRAQDALRGAAMDEPAAERLHALLDRAQVRSAAALAREPPTAAIAAQDLSRRLRAALRDRVQRGGDAPASASGLTGIEEVFERAPAGAEDTAADRRRHLTVAQVAARCPGVLAQTALEKMQVYFADRFRTAEGVPGKQLLPEVARMYLQTVVFAARPERDIGLRTSREMRTLTLAIGLIAGGHFLKALDVLTQRFKALEIATDQGNWNHARWVELLPPADVSSWSRTDLREAMREQDLEVRLGLAPGPSGGGRASGGGTGRRRSRQESEPEEVSAGSRGGPARASRPAAIAAAAPADGPPGRDAVTPGEPRGRDAVTPGGFGGPDGDSGGLDGVPLTSDPGSLHCIDGVCVVVGGLPQWRRDDGAVYVGRGVPHLGISRSWWADFLEGASGPAGRAVRAAHGVDGLASPGILRGAAREALLGRILRVGTERELELVRRVITTFTLDQGTVQHLAGAPELLPVSLPSPPDAYRRVRAARVADQAPASEDLLEAGIFAWLSLALAATNFLYTGGPRLLTRTMVHPRAWSAAQSQAVGRVRRQVTMWVRESPPLQRGSVSSQADRREGEYWGCQLARQLRNLERLLDGPALAALQDPSRLRLDERDVEEPLPTAKVLVESDAEYFKICENLHRLGVIEAEVPDETWTHKGRPVRNGLFGAHKKWVETDRGIQRVLRLIVNLVPTNALQRPFGGASKRMGYPGLWPLMTIFEDEVGIFYSEDQKACFHLYAVPRPWRGAFVLEKKVPRSALGLSGSGEVRPRLRACPMGWVSAVDFIQEAHENLVASPPPLGAGISRDLLVRMGAPAPATAGGAPRNWYSVYVDNWDQGKVVLKTEMGDYLYKASGEQLALRDAYANMGVLRDPAKAAEGTTVWESLGAQLRGGDRLAGTSATRRSAVLSLLLEAVTADDVSGDDLLLIIGKVCHILQFARPYFAIFQEVFHEARRERRRGPIGPMAGDELILIACLLPIVWADLGATISGQVVATDASSAGGGACVSTGLSPKGVRRLQVLRHGAGPARSDVLLVLDFDCMGAACAAMELLRVVPCGVIAVEGAALEDSLRLATWLREDPGWAVFDLFGSISTNGADEEQRISQALGVAPVFVEAADVHRCRRPCLHWARGFPIEPVADLIDRGAEGGRRILEGVATWQPPLEAFLGASVIKFADAQEPFYAFCQPVKRFRPPERPAGHDACSEKARRRWGADAFRLPPYACEDVNLVKAPGGPRRLRADEQSLILGFPPQHLKPCEKSIKKDQVEDCKGGLIGGALPAVIVARLLTPFVLGQAAGLAEPTTFGTLWRAWADIQEAHREQTGLGWTHLRALRLTPAPILVLSRPRSSCKSTCLRAADHKGTDVRLDAGMPCRLSAWPRDPIDSGLWTWRVALSCEFKNSQHINTLEATAVFDWARHGQRVAERQPRGRLRDQLVSPRTLDRYKLAVRAFFNFLRESKRGLPTSLVALDQFLEFYIEALWELGDSKAMAGDLLSGLGHFLPAVRRHMSGAWRLHKAWGRAELPARAPPLTPLFTYALAQLAFNKGWKDTGLFLVLGFDTFARPGELFNARVRDFILNIVSGQGVWSLPRSKSGERQGAMETIALDDPWVVRLIALYIHGMAPDHFLSTVSGEVHRRRLATLCQELYLNHGFRWYSLRRGGATFQKSRNFGELMIKASSTSWLSPSGHGIPNSDVLRYVGFARMGEVEGFLGVLQVAVAPCGGGRLHPRGLVSSLGGRSAPFKGLVWPLAVLA
ncbi:unnamed protein product [Prorocentrum cordatum]|uniref:RNA-directed RNA polymerase n=1 Tax=Prorocentrum cordatum TaxID=2364126 RepID=A0ABN9UYZ8_9DINO|nr:unnamed protein product [Polarella glacialis]